jgi:hypothetical protein
MLPVALMFGLQWFRFWRVAASAVLVAHRWAFEAGTRYLREREMLSAAELASRVALSAEHATRK